MSVKFGLWKFQVVGSSEKEPPQRGWINADFVGTEEQAKDQAVNLRAEFIMRNPSARIEVLPEFLEPIGPLVNGIINLIAGQSQTNMALARFIAARMAPYVARESLQLNPNLSRVAEGILQESLQMMATAERHSKKAAPATVVPDGKPATAGGTA
jgi:hypothetical protein